MPHTQFQAKDSNRFWMLLVDGHRGPKYRWAKLEEAFAEATRLYSLHHRKVFVLEMIGGLKHVKRKTERPPRLGHSTPDRNDASAALKSEAPVVG